MRVRSSGIPFLCSMLSLVLGLGLASPGDAAEPALTPVRYAEVIHSVFYAPSYIAMSKGFFKKQGLDVEMTTAQGSDKAAAALLTGAADIALAGPETSIYIKNGESPVKLKIFCGLTATDGSYLVGRQKAATFDWSMVKGKTIISWREGSSPDLFLQYVLRQHGIDPAKDVTIVRNIAIPARVGAFLGGAGDFGTYFEPDVSRMEMEGKAYPLASVGQYAGQIDYTVFEATDAYIAVHPKVVQGWTNAIYQAQRWLASAPPEEAAKALAPYFPGIPLDLLAATVKRHREGKLFKDTPVVAPAAINKLQDLLIAGGVLKATQRVKPQDVIAAQFATKAVETIH